MKVIKVVAAVIRNENEIFACKRSYGEFKGGWEFPGGKVEVGESLEAALKREIKEELEIEISVNEFIKTVEYDYPDFHLSMDCYFCNITSGDIILNDHSDFKWVNKQNIDELNWLAADIELVKTIKSKI